jgi:hypothetical protein
MAKNVENIVKNNESFTKNVENMASKYRKYEKMSKTWRKSLGKNCWKYGDKMSNV